VRISTFQSSSRRDDSMSRRAARAAVFQAEELASVEGRIRRG
jgi:hypothetical protein